MILFQYYLNKLNLTWYMLFFYSFNIFSGAENGSDEGKKSLIVGYVLIHICISLGFSFLGLTLSYELASYLESLRKTREMWFLCIN